MADCFSLQSIKEIIEDLRDIEKYGESTISSYEAGNYADAIESVLAENEQIRMQRASELGQLYGKVKLLQDDNAKLKAERDAAVADLKDLAYCTKCLHENKYPINNPCCVCQGNMWEWRGVRGRE